MNILISASMPGHRSIPVMVQLFEDDVNKLFAAETVIKRNGTIPLISVEMWWDPGIYYVEATVDMKALLKKDKYIVSSEMRNTQGACRLPSAHIRIGSVWFEFGPDENHLMRTASVSLSHLDNLGWGV